MQLDMWILFATGQTLLLAVGVCIVLALRARTTRRALAEAEARCKAALAALEDGKKLLDARTVARDWKAEMGARLAAAEADAAKPNADPALAIRRAVLKSELDGSALDLSALVGENAGGAPSPEFEALKAAHASLEAENATLRAEREAAATGGDGAPSNLARERELKSLVQQFTRDSREMLSCIQALESENKELRASVGRPTKTAA